MLSAPVGHIKYALCTCWSKHFSLRFIAVRERERERETDRQTDRQRETERDRQTDRVSLQMRAERTAYLRAKWTLQLTDRNEYWKSTTNVSKTPQVTHFMKILSNFLKLFHNYRRNNFNRQSSGLWKNLKCGQRSTHTLTEWKWSWRPKLLVKFGHTVS